MDCIGLGRALLEQGWLNRYGEIASEAGEAEGGSARRAEQQMDLIAQMEEQYSVTIKRFVLPRATPPRNCLCVSVLCRGFFSHVHVTLLRTPRNVALYLFIAAFAYVCAAGTEETMKYLIPQRFQRVKRSRR